MDINPLLTSLAETIASDADLEAWCQAEYGRSVQVRINFDTRLLVGEGDCPCVCVHPGEKQYGGNTYADAVNLDCMVDDDRMRGHAGYDTVIEYQGVYNVETMRKLVLTAAAGVIEATDDSRINSISVDYDAIQWFPRIVAYQAIEIETPYLLGSGHPARNE